MLRMIAGQLFGAYLAKVAASGRYSRGASAIIGLLATRLGGASRFMGIASVLAALTGRSRR
jgi:hypothetical protein